MFEFIKEFFTKKDQYEEVSGVQVHDKRKNQTDLDSIPVLDDDPIMSIMVNAAFNGKATMGRIDEDGKLTIEDAEHSMEWISVETKLPESDQVIDVWCKKSGRHANYRYIKDYMGIKGNCFFDPVACGICCIRTTDDYNPATHWMLEPSPPKT